MSILKIAFTLSIAAVSLATAQPTGLCLHAYSPQAPADKIECFEYQRVERLADGYRFFLFPQGTSTVTNYRYRGTIIYKPNLTTGHPDFASLLKQYEETARATPSTRVYLNPKILSMREKNAGRLAENLHAESLPRISIGGNEYRSPQFKAFDNGKLVMGHTDGVLKIDLDKMTDSNLQDLAKIDPKAVGIKVIKIAEHRLWNPSYKGLSDGNVSIAHEAGSLSLDLDSLSEKDCKKITDIDQKFGNNKTVSIAGSKLWNPSFQDISSTTVRIKHEKGVLPLEIDDISDKDKKTIMSWSDGTWKVAKPGFYDPEPGSGSYRELVLESGKFYKNVEIKARDGEDISIRCSSGTIKVPFEKLASKSGMMPQDQERIAQWANEILDKRLEVADSESTPEVLGFQESPVLRVTNVRLKILQILDNGVLVSNFFGNLHKGTETVRITETKSAKHPLSGEIVKKVVDTSTVKRDVNEDVRDDLCYIIGNTGTLTDGDVAKAKSIKLEGRYQYVDVQGVPRTVRKYSVD